MSNARSITLSALNIAAAPHPPRIYGKLFDEARKSKIEAKYIKNDYVFIRQFKELKKGSDVYAGIFYRYTRTDNWVNRETLKAAGEDGEIEVDLPEGYDANVELFMFVLYGGADHKLIYESKDRNVTLSSRYLRKALEVILKQTKTAKKLESLNVNIETNKNALDAIYNAKTVESLELKISRPNSDGPSSEFDSIIDQIEEAGASELREKFISEKGIKVKTPVIRDRLEATTSNGWAKARVTQNDGEKETINTTNYPLTDKIKYDPSEPIARVDAIKNGIKAFARKMKIIKM